MKRLYIYQKSKLFFILLFLLGGMLLFPNKVQASTKLQGISNFPQSYQPYLQELQKKFPKWKFTAVYTNLDWNYVIQKENEFGKNLVPKSYSDSWKNTKPGEYNVEVDLGWVDASKRAVEYCMDPRNFLNEGRIFQFETLSYEETENQKEGVEKILYGTEFYNNQVFYYDEYGNSISMAEKYSDLILRGGKTSSVSPYHLSSRIKQEVGPFLSHASISGLVEGFKGLYNFYNIGATSSAEPMGAIKNGLRYARDGKGASQATKDKYLLPWNNKEKAITGGGIFIGSSYINIGQNTIYFQKFDVNDDKAGELFWHQYMTNVLAPYSESKSIQKGYANSNLLQGQMNFMIPVYENMPQLPTESPDIHLADYTPDNTRIYAKVSNTLNVRSGPSTNHETIAILNANEQMTRIAKGRQSGELWDRVKLDNGMIGYVFQKYTEEVPNHVIQDINVKLEKTKINKTERTKMIVEKLPKEAEATISYLTSDASVALIDETGSIVGVGAGKVKLMAQVEHTTIRKEVELEVYSPVTDLYVDRSTISLPVGQKTKINAFVLPEDANNQTISYSSSNEAIAKVDSSGMLTALKEGTTQVSVITQENNIRKQIEVTIRKAIDPSEISFDESLKIENSQITKLNDKGTTAAQMSEKITSIYPFKIVNYKNQELKDSDLVGTDSKVLFYNKDEVIAEYQILLYGDVNGDGRINSVDLFLLQRHILQLEMFQGNFLKAANVQKNEKNPNSVDLLILQRHILGLKQIEQ